jgi:pimeloyl-ACP methyl ester carboxylesterase
MMAPVQIDAGIETFRSAILPAIRAADHQFLDTIAPFSFDVATLPAPFERPALILNGRQDAQTGYADVLALIESFPRGTFAILDRSGHGVAAEQPVLFAELVNEWLDRVELESYHQMGEQGGLAR